MAHIERPYALTCGTDFPHRKNADLTFDAICPKCFQTISNRKLESDLKEDETAHFCQSGSIANRDRPARGTHLFRQGRARFSSGRNCYRLRSADRPNRHQSRSTAEGAQSPLRHLQTRALGPSGKQSPGTVQGVFR